MVCLAILPGALLRRSVSGDGMRAGGWAGALLRLVGRKGGLASVVGIHVGLAPRRRPRIGVCASSMAHGQQVSTGAVQINRRPVIHEYVVAVHAFGGLRMHAGPSKELHGSSSL